MRSPQPASNKEFGDRLPAQQPDPTAPAPVLETPDLRDGNVTFASRTPAADVPARDRIVFTNPFNPAKSTVIEADGTRTDGVSPPAPEHNTTSVLPCVGGYCAGYSYTEGGDGASSVTVMAGGRAYLDRPTPPLAVNAGVSYEPPAETWDVGFKGQGVLAATHPYKLVPISGGFGVNLTVSGRNLFSGEPTADGNGFLVLNGAAVGTGRFSFKYDANNGLSDVSNAKEYPIISPDSTIPQTESGAPADTQPGAPKPADARPATTMPDTSRANVDVNQVTGLAYLTVPLSSDKNRPDEWNYKQNQPADGWPKSPADPSPADPGLIPDSPASSETTPEPAPAVPPTPSTQRSSADWPAAEPATASADATQPQAGMTRAPGGTNVDQPAGDGQDFPDTGSTSVYPPLASNPAYPADGVGVVDPPSFSQPGGSAAPVGQGPGPALVSDAGAGTYATGGDATYSGPAPTGGVDYAGDMTGGIDAGIGIA